MTDRESQIRELARSMWESEGSPEGRHEDHWLEAEKQIDRKNNSLPLASDAPRPPEMDLEPIPRPDQVPADGDVSPGRSGQKKESSGTSRP